MPVYFAVDQLTQDTISNCTTRANGFGSEFDFVCFGSLLLMRDFSFKPFIFIYQNNMQKVFKDTKGARESIKSENEYGHDR